jgi:hypothetical protein
MPEDEVPTTVGEELDSDELWEQAQAQGADSSPPPVETEDTESAPPEPEAPTFDISPYLPQIADYFVQNVLPQYQTQAVDAAMKRTTASIRDRDKAINQRLAPLLTLLQRQHQQGLLTPEDAQREYAEAHKIAAQELADAEEKAQALAEYQALQNRQTPVPVDTPRPVWIVDTEDEMNKLLAQSGLTDADPELALVPSEITHPSPRQALKDFEYAVATAVQVKQQRIGQSTGPANGNGAKPRPRVPTLDMGTGGSPGSINPIANVEDTDELWRLATGGR